MVTCTRFGDVALLVGDAWWSLLAWVAVQLVFSELADDVAVSGDVGLTLLSGVFQLIGFQ